jgi:hypothetical protein
LVLQHHSQFIRLIYYFNDWHQWCIVIFILPISHTPGKIQQWSYSRSLQTQRTPIPPLQKPSLCTWPKNVNFVIILTSQRWNVVDEFGKNMS